LVLVLLVVVLVVALVRVWELVLENLRLHTAEQQTPTLVLITARELVRVVVVVVAELVLVVSVMIWLCLVWELVRVCWGKTDTAFVKVAVSFPTWVFP
jgi:hypothetical protein